MDQDQDGDEQAGAAPVVLACDYGALLTTASGALVTAVNAYRRQAFPAGPSIGTLRVSSSKNSILVQAADLLANFGVASAKLKLRCGSESSERELVRSRIFESLVPPAALPVSSTLRVTERNELDGTVDDNLHFVLMAFPPN